MDKISIIIPVFNSEKYLSACLESVVGQTYENLEIIIINDGSEDHSGDICDEFALKDKRIQVIHKKNHGVSAARNDGLELATGKWISFIDSDDTLDLDMYDVLMDMNKDGESQIIHCGYKRIEKDEIRLVHGTGKVYVQNSNEALKCLVSGILFDSGLWNKLFLRDNICDLRFNTELKNNEDILFNFQAFSRCRKAIFVDEAKYNYHVRIGESAVFTISTAKKVHDSVVVNKYIYEQSDEKELKSLATDRYLMSLSYYFRVCKKNKNQEECNGIKRLMWQVFKKSEYISRNVKITVWLINYMPDIYLIMYNVYDRIRKPKWEAQLMDED